MGIVQGNFPEATQYQAVNPADFPGHPSLANLTGLKIGYLYSRGEKTGVGLEVQGSRDTNEASKCATGELGLWTSLKPSI